MLSYFGLPHDGEPDLSRWHRIVHTVRQPEGEVTIAVVGKYTSLLDSYKSLAEALIHGGIANNVRVNLDWIDAEIFDRTTRSSTWSMSMASWCRAASASAGRKARSGRSSSPASTRYLISASASACRWR